MSAESIAFQTGHVGLNVTNLERSKQFYQTVFGFDVMGESTDPGRQFAFLGQAGKLLVTLWQQSEGEFSPNRPGLHHLSFQVESGAQVEQVEQKLRSIGAKILHDGVVTHSEKSQSAVLFFLDPDGIRLEVYSPTGGQGRKTPTQGAPACGFF